MNIFSAEFCDKTLLFCDKVLAFCVKTLLFSDEAFEIVDDCKESRDILSGVLRGGPVFKTHFEMRNISSHYILFRRYYKKIFWSG